MKIGLFDSGVGVIPFINEIIYQKKNNEYYIYIDQEVFPYGNKEENELLNRLLEIIDIFEKLKIKKLIIACNTMSYIYLKYLPKTTYKVLTILEVNLKSYDQEKELIGTQFLYNNMEKYYQIINGKNLAYLIENNMIQELIEEIKKYNINKTTILACTHYSLARPLFESIYPNIKFISNENIIIEQLKSYSKTTFYINKMSKDKVKKYFSDSIINFNYF